MRDLVRVTLISALILPTIGCKGPTGLSGKKQLNELNDEEQIEACEALDDYFNEELGEEQLHRFGCTFGALFVSASEAECDVAFESCLQTPDSSEPTEEDMCTADGMLACMATVREWEDCIEEEVEQTIDFIDSFSCAAAFSDNPPDLNTEPGPACKALAEECPGFWGPDGEGT